MEEDEKFDITFFAAETEWRIQDVTSYTLGRFERGVATGTGIFSYSGTLSFAYRHVVWFYHEPAQLRQERGFGGSGVKRLS